MRERAPASVDAPVIDALYEFARAAAAKGRHVTLPDPYDPDFELANAGIDSVLVADLAVALEARFEVELDFPALYRAATLSDVLRLVGRAREAARCPR